MIPATNKEVIKCEENTEKTEKYACKSSRPGNTICGVRIQNTIISRGSRLTGIDRLGQKGNF